MATRSAPALSTDPSFLHVQSSWIDASGDVRSVSIDGDPTATNAEIDAMLDNTQAASNASLFRVEVGNVWSSVPSKANATAGVYPSVYDNVALLFKTATNFSRNWFVPAPDATLMGTDSDTPETAPAQAIALSVVNVLEGASATEWFTVSARFTERREKNQRIFI